MVIGYDKNRIYFEDPSSFSRTFLTYKEMAERWHDHDFDKKKYFNFGIAVYGKKSNYNSKKIVHLD